MTLGSTKPKSPWSPINPQLPLNISLNTESIHTSQWGWQHYSPSLPHTSRAVCVVLRALQTLSSSLRPRHGSVRADQGKCHSLHWGFRMEPIAWTVYKPWQPCLPALGPQPSRRDTTVLYCYSEKSPWAYFCPMSFGNIIHSAYLYYIGMTNSDIVEVLLSFINVITISKKLI